MSYKVQYSVEARQDLKDIFNYIAQKLLVPDAAKNQTRRIMEYNNLYDDFAKLFVDDNEELSLISQKAAADVSDGMHIMFGMVVVPFVIKLIEEENEIKLKMAFDFFEQMSLSKDSLICEVVEFTILEDLISRGRDIVDKCKIYMGKETLECCRAVEKYMM